MSNLYVLEPVPKYKKTTILRRQITDSFGFYEFTKEVYKKFPQYVEKELFFVAGMNSKNEITFYKKVTEGGVAQTVVDVSLVMKELILHTATTAFIVFHNHPSGNLKPSQADIHITDKLKKAGDIMGLKMLDHIIYTDNGYYSFTDELR